MKCDNANGNGRKTSEVQMPEFQETGNDCVDGVLMSTLETVCQGTSVETPGLRSREVHGLETPDWSGGV